MNGHERRTAPADLGPTITVCCKSAGSAVQFLSFDILSRRHLALSFRPVPRPRVVRKKLAENCDELDSSHRERSLSTFGQVNLPVNELVRNIRRTDVVQRITGLFMTFCRRERSRACDRSAKYERGSY